MSKNFSFQIGLLVCICIATFVVPAQSQNPNLVAYAHVLGDGTLDAAGSKNVVAFETDTGNNGLFCFMLNFRPNNSTATLAQDPTAPDQGVGFIKVAVAPHLGFSCGVIQNPDGQVETGDQTSINGGISTGGYAFYVYWTR